MDPILTKGINTLQYLTKEYLTENIPEILIKPEDLGTADTYNEEKMLNKYLSLPKDGQILLLKSAIQLAVVGYGNKNYGFIRVNDKEIMTLEQVFNKYNVKYKEKENIKYAEEELSARRLLRLFRYQIQQFIINYKRPSYLWLKYADKQNKDFYSICFPGAEHLVENKDEAEFLLKTCGKLDVQFKSKFCKRLQRVFIARNILSPEYFIDKMY